jgi:tetratricopeptide (TPR) repeat protein
MREIERLVLCKSLQIFFLFGFINIFIYSQRYPNQEVNKLLDVGIEYILNQNYELASSKFNILNKKYPDLPLGKIYLAVVDITKAFDYGEEFNSESIGKNLDDALALSEKLLEKNHNNIWNHYFVALSKGYKSYLRVLNGDWLSALSSGLSSVNYFEDCLEIDSSFYESYVALGTYKFWKSRKLEFLEWLPFFDDESENGIRYLEIALDKTSYNKNLAAVSLIWIYIEKKNFYRAIDIAEKELKKNPINRTLKWALARAYEDVNPGKAIQIYNEIIISYQKIPNQNHYNEITLKHIIAQQYSKMGEKREALRLCDEILAIQNLTEYVKEKLDDRLKRVRKLKKELTSKN